MGTDWDATDVADGDWDCWDGMEWEASDYCTAWPWVGEPGWRPGEVSGLEKAPGFETWSVAGQRSQGCKLLIGDMHVRCGTCGNVQGAGVDDETVSGLMNLVVLK